MSKQEQKEESATEAKPPAVPMTGGALAAIDETKAWGADLTFDPADLKVGELRVMNAMSDLVKEGKAKIGDWVDASSKAVIAKAGQKVELLVFNQRKVIFQKQNGKSLRPEIYDAKRHAALPREKRSEDGRTVLYKSTVAFEYTGLIAGRDIASSLPVVLLFQSTGYQEGQRLSTMFRHMALHGLPSAARVVELTTEDRKNDQGSWLGVVFSQGRESTAEELAACKAWYEALSAGTHEVEYGEELARGDAQRGNTPPPPSDDAFNWA